MGLLSQGSPLSWEETRRHAEHVRKHGILQFLHIYRALRDRHKDVLKWGDEVRHPPPPRLLPPNTHPGPDRRGLSATRAQVLRCGPGLARRGARERVRSARPRCLGERRRGGKFRLPGGALFLPPHPRTPSGSLAASGCAARSPRCYLVIYFFF